MIVTYKYITAFDGSELILRKAGSEIIVFPKDVANNEYQAFLTWVAAGNTPLPADPPPPPQPQSPTLEQRTEALELLLDFLLEPTP